MRRLWNGYLKHHKWWMALAIVLMVIEGSTLAILSYMLQPMFDNVFAAGNKQAVWWVGGIIFGLFLVRAITQLAQKTIMTRIAQKTSTSMQVDLLRHLMRLDSVFFQKNPPGALMERVQGDTNAVQQVWGVIISGAGRDAISLISLLGLALSIDWVWTLVAVVGAPLLVVPVYVLQKYIRRKTSHMRQQASLRSTRLDEVFHGINPIKLNLLEEYQANRFSSIIDTIVSAEVKTAASRAMIPSLIDIITGLGFFGVMIVGGQDIIEGEKTIGQFMSFFSAMALAFQPMRRLGSISGIWQVAAASLERLYRLFDTEPTIVSPATPAKPVKDTELVMQDVTFAYDDTPVLNATTLTAEAGKTTALVGASGAGKSTIFNVLTRLVEPQSGKTTVGGTPINELALNDLRGMFSVVTQDALLFDETIRENILLGRTDVSDHQLQDALDAAHVTDFLDKLPNGLDTPAGPRGSNLSGGQRQRVAIARAILRDTPILLLDEATSALDAHSEAVVQKALERLSKGRTTLVIAHRLSTIQSADKIIVMEKGRVVDQGTHEELLAGGGIYAELHRLQFKENAPIGGANPLDPPEGPAGNGGGLTVNGGEKTGLFSRFARRLFGR
ncbi:ABC transporter ATP-binding protein [Profundibacter amoris]|uniref:ABC transporter ATP-binding protein n=2 Tax=Profundibacter amoris TaxID=2171755 RepID=A0A347ULW0_9RHOB|nr:ABC transporter ATP-binding protein [Profundibacter amoris]